MHFIDELFCTQCGACANICPTEAIYQTEDDTYQIDEECIDCGSCLAECPVDCISRVD